MIIQHKIVCVFKVRKILLVCPSSPDYYGDPVSRKCVTNCPTVGSILLFADVFDSKRLCVPLCKAETFARNDTQRCV